MKVHKKNKPSVNFDSINLGSTFRLEGTFESPIFMKIRTQTSIPVDIAVDLSTGLGEAVNVSKSCYLTSVECTEL